MFPSLDLARGSVASRQKAARMQAVRRAEFRFRDFAVRRFRNSEVWVSGFGSHATAAIMSFEIADGHSGFWIRAPEFCFPRSGIPAGAPASSAAATPAHNLRARRTQAGFGLVEILLSTLLFAFAFLSLTLSYLGAVHAWKRSGEGFSSAIEKWNAVQEFRMSPGLQGAPIQLGGDVPPLRRTVLVDGFGRPWEAWSDAR